MQTRLLVLPAVCLAGAILLFAELPPSAAFSKIGGSLNESQRDVRVFDNFLDATANDNTTESPQFPGWTGVELAVWKGISEWASLPHGDGSGDPQSGNVLGDGGANFDAMWSGSADGIGTSNTNIVSSQPTCGGSGTLAYCETPISDGWRIRFCDEWTWDDGPGAIGSRFDLQGVLTHEYGHALGLGHSGNGQATMAPSVGAGQTSIRSIHADDIAGIQCIYGLVSATKPTIVATVADAGAGTLTIYGTQFGGVDNEVWFTNKAVTATGVDPIVRVAGLAAAGNGTILVVPIPLDAGPGDVLVNKFGGGGATLSNAFPTDLVGTFGLPPSARPDITAVTPATIDALIPGTDQTITITGTDLDLTTELRLDGVAIELARYTIVDASTITLDMPQTATLGQHELAVTDGATVDAFAVTVVAPATPRYELGSGDPGNAVDRDLGLTLLIAGVPGRRERVYASLSSVPSVNGSFTLDIGNHFTNLFNGGEFVIPAAGWLRVDVPTALLPDPGPAGLVFFSQTVEMRLPRPFADGNLQSIRLVQ